LAVSKNSTEAQVFLEVIIEGFNMQQYTLHIMMVCIVNDYIVYSIIYDTHSAGLGTRA
jgi:hypothetical protein